MTVLVHICWSNLYSLTYFSHITIWYLNLKVQNPDETIETEEQREWDDLNNKLTKRLIKFCLWLIKSIWQCYSSKKNKTPVEQWIVNLEFSKVNLLLSKVKFIEKKMYQQIVPTGLSFNIELPFFLLVSFCFTSGLAVESEWLGFAVIYMSIISFLTYIRLMCCQNELPYKKLFHFLFL